MKLTESGTKSQGPLNPRGSCVFPTGVHPGVDDLWEGTSNIEKRPGGGEDNISLQLSAKVHSWLVAGPSAGRLEGFAGLVRRCS
jgi:hypothetical protein